jgi:hypothetical protein
MTKHRSPSADSQSIIEGLAQPPRVDSLGPIAQRFVYSLRMVALHERVRKDPVPELSVRLGSVEIAAKALSLSQAISSCWPENVRVSRFCCQLLTHDEATVGAMLDSAAACDRAAFDANLTGFVRPERIHRLWDGVLALIAAEVHAA